MKDRDCPQCGKERNLEGRQLNMWKGTVTYICKDEECLYEEEHKA